MAIQTAHQPPPAPLNPSQLVIVVHNVLVMLRVRSPVGSGFRIGIEIIHGIREQKHDIEIPQNRLV